MRQFGSASAVGDVRAFQTQKTLNQEGFSANLELIKRQVCLTVSRFTSVAYRGAAVSGTRAFLPAAFGGWPVGGGSDMTGRLAPWASLTAGGASTSATAALDLVVAVVFRTAFAFGAGLAGLILIA